MTTNVALVRGNSLNVWEGKLWDSVPGFSVTGFCSKKNLYPVDTLAFPVVRLSATTDSKFCNGWFSYVHGQFQKMVGLEKALSGYAIAHTAEIYNYYTWQAVQAKKNYRHLRVATTVWDNSFGRFDRAYVGGFAPPAWWTTRMKKLIAENAAGVDRFIAVSTGSKKLLQHYGVPEEKIRVITPGLIAYTIDQSRTVLDKYHLRAPLYLMVNRLTKEKGIYYVLVAWKKFVLQSGQKALLVIVGDGVEREAMLRLIREEGLSDSIRYIPYMPNQELRQLYPHAKALILASIPTPFWEEQFGYVLAEAMISGCPVISTKTGAIPEVVGTAGVLVAPHDSDAIVEALRKMEDQKIHAALCIEAKKSQERFSAERFHYELIKVYNELV